ncbi:ComEA family DNA-binding protein [Flavihumibacter profundi]|uniref:ComEA family DNA-binding protein n=1 Tax=Flavihumibacter profundi TaxID=2716883 RepID=UPI001CC50BBF|nr:helix-hairpin-helix domain-containing protein [Flavihumibacter profundi]MBZ5858161.1 helix-hairpin-helix domain-containing protein [Flavihumibacter profundi]
MKKFDLRRLTEDYFSFSTRERWAVLVLVVIILILFILPDFLPEQESRINIADSLITSAVKQFDSAGNTTKGPQAILPNQANGISSPERFPFDPNLLGRDEWIRLGLRPKTAETILKYRAKGGRFRSAGDLEKIYGLSPELARQLIPWVKIMQVQEKSQPSYMVRPRQDSIHPFRRNPSKEQKAQKVAVNTADSLAWLALPGIGPKLAGRILNFRKKLGGFFQVSQVAEVYGLPDSVFRKIEPLLEEDQQHLQLIPINTATEAELAVHPYIRHYLAAAIIQYRNAHGPFKEKEELMGIHLLKQEQYEKIVPYLKMQ